MTASVHASAQAFAEDAGRPDISVRRHRPPVPGESPTVRFEGKGYGSPVSMFITDSAPGTGSQLHVHPYRETWVVRKGAAEFLVGDERLRAFAGDIVVAPADVPHRYLNVGTEQLELVCIHPSDTIRQQDL